MNYTKYIAIEAALNAIPNSDNWVFAKYGPKTLGVGIGGGPALLMVRPSDCIDVDEMVKIVGDLITILKGGRRLLDDAYRGLAMPSLLAAAVAAEDVFAKQKWLPNSSDPEAVVLRKLREAIAQTTNQRAA